MICCTASLADTSAGNTLLNGFVGNEDLQNLVDLHAHFVQCLGLRHAAGKTVQNEAILAVVLCNAFLQDPDDNIVGNQSTAVHRSLCLDTIFGAGADCLTQHIAGGNLRNRQCL